MRNATAKRMGVISIKILIINILLRRGFESLIIKVCFMQLPGSATLTKPFSRAELFVELIKMRSLIGLRRLFEVGLISLVLSYWEKYTIDRN